MSGATERGVCFVARSSFELASSRATEPRCARTNSRSEGANNEGQRRENKRKNAARKKEEEEEEEEDEEEEEEEEETV